MANPGRYKYCQAALCQQQIRLGILLALPARSDFAARPFGPNGMPCPPLAQGQLARHLSRLPPWQTEAQALNQTLRQRLAPGSRSDLPNVPPAWQWLGDRTALQAEYLRLALTRNESADTLARLVQGLLDLRQNGTWGSTYANGAAWQALGEYQAAQPPANLTVTIQGLGPALTANLRGDRPSSKKFPDRGSLGDAQFYGCNPKAAAPCTTPWCIATPQKPPPAAWKGYALPAP
ncbi:MAG: hypothetical protein HC918_05260 [Oscillatoriales cyanobacterium SM2_1_8]|nr:hypothetical protein [Oscillatoriales cyanobacterium SM2_1_8]